MKDTRPIPVVVRNVVSGLCALLLILFPGGAMLFAQDVPQQGAPPYQGDPQYQGPPQPDGPQGQGQILTPDQLSNLVAPVALYPDNLLSQVLAASTYPLEIVEAAQWLQQNRNLQGQQLIDAARQQNWDPSIQAMVAFPDVLNRLASDVQWTTALGNAFLAQQNDVMSAVQRLRAEARSNGKLNSNAQQQVTTQQQNGQTAIDIAPVNPEVVYVPVYNPEYVWGPPVWGYYPPLYYPGFAFGFGFGPGIYLGGFFPGFGFGFGGWGWGFNWFGGGIFTRGLFFSNFGFHPGWGGWRGGAWSHVAGHRLGVPYSNRAVASRFGGNFNARGGLGRAGTEHGFANNGARGNSFNGAHANGLNGSHGNSFNGARNGSSFNGSRSFAQGNRAEGGNWQHFGGQSGAGARPAQPSARSNPSFGGNNSFRGGSFNSFGGSNSFHGAPSARPSGGSFSAPRSSGGSSFHGGSSGGGFHGGGGGGSHGGGGGHGGGGHR